MVRQYLAGLALASAAVLAVPAVPAVAAEEAQAVSAAMPDWWPGDAERVAIRAEVEALLHEYYYLIDHGEAESVQHMFTPDAVLRIVSREPLRGRAAIAEHYANRSKALVTRHVTSNLRVRHLGPDHVEALRVITYYRGLTTDGPGPYPATPAVVEYTEELVRGDDGRWRFTSRKSIPLFTPFTRRDAQD